MAHLGLRSLIFLGFPIIERTKPGFTMFRAFLFSGLQGIGAP